MCIEVEIDVFRRNQVDRHVVAVLHLLAQNQVVAQTFNAVVSLHGRLLGYDKINASGFQASHVTTKQVVAHKVEIRTSVALHILADNVRLRVEGDTALHVRMRRKEIVQQRSIFTRLFGIFSSGQCSFMYS